MKANYAVVFVAFFQVFCLAGFAQQTNLKFEHIGSEEGLSQNFVKYVFQDSKGFMWFGTSDGLNKYDGYKFTIYQKNDVEALGLKSNQINQIAEDADGNVWIATTDALSMFDRKSERFTHYLQLDHKKTNVANSYVNGLTISEGKVWIATGARSISVEGGGVLSVLDIKSKKIDHYIYSKADAVANTSSAICVYKDKQQNLWVGTNDAGLQLFDPVTHTFTAFSHDDANNTSIASNNIRMVFEDSRNNLWVATRNNGLDLFDRKTKTFRHFTHEPGNDNSLPTNSILSLAEDRNGQLWIGTENGGLSIYNTETKVFKNYLQDVSDPHGLNSNSIYSIYRDVKGNMWLGTFSGGINFFNADGSKFDHYKQNFSPNTINNNVIFDISGDSKGNLLLATDGGGLNIYNPVTGKFTYLMHKKGNKNSIAGNHVLSVLEDSDHNLWIGTWGEGVTVYNQEKKSYRHFKNDPADPGSLSSNNAWTIFEDRQKNIWIGTYWGGLCLYNPKENNFTRFMQETDPRSIGSNVINAIFQDKNGDMWIGTMGGGLDFMDRKTNTFTHYLHDENKNSISSNIVNNIFEDSKGRLWMSTGAGLNYFDRKTKRFTVYTVKDGLCHDYIRAVLEDAAGNLWLSTNGGISQFNPDTKKSKTYTVVDGLQALEFKSQAAFKTPAGAMYFGGINGVNKFLPDSGLHELAYEPPIVITDFQVFNQQVGIADSLHPDSPLDQSISETSEITLSHKQSVITFEFASLNYTATRKKQYAYMLEGFDKDWNNIGTKHTATYTNLDPGNYVFRVKGLNNEGKWSENMAEMKVTITPPFWVTWWFRLAVLAMVAGGAIAFFRIRVNRINKQKIMLEQLVVEKTHQLTESTREEQRARQEADTARYETEIANEKLGRKNKELEQFAYIASHDLQEPLRTTSSFVQLLRRQYEAKLDEKANKYLSYISDSSERMKVLVTDLLDFSRIGTKAKLEKVDCGKILEDVLEDLMIAIQESKAIIRAGNMPVINGYPTEIKQLFQNLVLNAIKFRKKDSIPEIQICVQKRNDTWGFVVKDNGIGIDKEHCDRIFVIFQRLHTREEYQGSGIGLAHCKKIVELHGGKIWVESVKGEGCAFHFNIPVLADRN